jgi:membrane protein implicated in regulation of membrane protease activity
MHDARIDLRRLALTFLFALVLPVGAALVVDIVWGLLPWTTIAAIVLVFPVAAVVITRTALRELDRVSGGVESADHPSGEPEAG